MTKTRKMFVDMPAYMRAGIVLVVVLILAAGGWYGYQTYSIGQVATAQPPVVQTATARRGDLVLYASGTGTLVPASDATFGFGTSGQVALVNVKVGDKVQAGDVLAELANASAQLSYEQAKRNLAEMTSPAAIAAAGQVLATAQQTLADTKNKVDSLLFPRASDALIDNVAGQIVLAKQRLARAADKYRQVERLADGNPTKAEALVAMTDAQLALNTLIAQYNWYEGVPTDNDAALAQANLDAAEAAVDEAQWYLSALKGDELPTNATGANLAQLQQLQDALKTAEMALNDTRLVTPISGTVMTLDFGVGDVIGSSITVTLADLEQPYYLEVYLDESDWDHVQVGYPTEVTFDVIPDQIFPGKVMEVNPGLIQVGNSSAVRCIVRLDTPIKAVMPSGTAASVDVIGGSATQAVLIPVDALREIGDGQYTVFVMQNGEPKLRVVEVGIQDLVSAEIISGLEAGDVVTTGIVETNQ